MMNTKTNLLIYFVITVCLVAYQYPLTFDVTANKINSLNEDNRTILSNVNKPLTVDFYSSDRHLVMEIQNIVSLFQQENSRITLTIHEKPLNPLDKTKLRLHTNNNLLLHYADKKKAFDINPINWNQETFGNNIQQIIRIQEDWVVFLSGHNERDPFSEENRDLSQLTTLLKTTGLNIALLNLSESTRIPDNTKMLVIADPNIAFLPSETNEILTFIKNGGNILWLADPTDITVTAATGLEKLTGYLGIDWQPGTILDKKSHALGTPDPAITLLTQYPKHPITEQLNMITVFPWARPLQYENAFGLGWQVTPLLVSNPSTILEFKKTQKPGPFTIGIALEKNNQRIVAIGNAQFLSNASIHHYGNLQLANNLFNWLIGTDFLLNTTTKPIVNLPFTQSVLTETTTQCVFPFCLPLIYLMIGWYMKRARKHRYQGT